MHNDICLQINSANIILKNIKYALYHRIFVTYTCILYILCFFNYSNFHNIFMTNYNFMIFVTVTIF